MISEDQPIRVKDPEKISNEKTYKNKLLIIFSLIATIVTTVFVDRILMAYQNPLELQSPIVQKMLENFTIIVESADQEMIKVDNKEPLL